jgi:hypothetical protein
MVNHRPRSMNDGLAHPLPLHRAHSVSAGGDLGDIGTQDESPPTALKRFPTCSPIPIVRKRAYSPSASAKESYALGGYEQSMLGVSPKINCENDMFDVPVSSGQSGYSASPPSYMAYHSSTPSSVPNPSGLGLYGSSPHASDVLCERIGRPPGKLQFGKLRDQIGSRERDDRTRAWANKTVPNQVVSPIPMPFNMESACPFLSANGGLTERQKYAATHALGRNSAGEGPIKEKAFGEAPGGREIEGMLFECMFSDGE